MRIVEVIAPERHAKELIGMGRFYGAADVWWGPANADGRQAFRMLVADSVRQRLLDALESLLERDPAARVVVFSVDATLPRLSSDAETEGQDAEQQQQRSISVTREELYTAIRIPTARRRCLAGWLISPPPPPPPPAAGWRSRCSESHGAPVGRAPYLWQSVQRPDPLARDPGCGPRFDRPRRAACR